MKFNTNYFLIALSGIMFGFIVTGGKYLSDYGFTLVELLVIPSFIAALFFLYHGITKFDEIKRAPKKVFYLYFFSITIAQIGQFVPIVLNVQPSLISMCLYTQPLWTILINRYFFKNNLKKYEIFTGFLVLIGTILLLNPFSPKNGYTNSPLGISLALIGGFALSIWLIASTSLTEKSNVSPYNLTFWGNVAGCLPFLIILPFIKLLPLNPVLSSYFVLSINKPISSWLLITGYALITWVGALVIFYKGSEKVPSLHSGIILLLEPVTVVFLDKFLLRSTLSWNIIIGAVFILTANSFLIYHSAMHERKLKEL